MVKKGIFFTFARQKGAPYTQIGIKSRGSGDKFWRFQMTLPMWQNNKIRLPLQLKTSNSLIELVDNEIKYVTHENTNSKYVDGLDCLSQLVLIDINYPYKPDSFFERKESTKRNTNKYDKIWKTRNEDDDDDEGNLFLSYV
jgi:hypothetical protein